MRTAPLALALFASACGGGAQTTSDPQAENVVEAAAKGMPAAVAAGTCDARPDFVPVRDDAKFLSCTSGRSGDKLAGTVLYTTTAEPGAALSWAKEQAIRAGLAMGVEDGTSFLAGDTKRRLKVTPQAGEARTTMRVEWSVTD
jgi:hypothetical protein